MADLSFSALPCVIVVYKQEIVILKDGGPLGLSIVGGSDHTSHPFGLDEPGIFISKVFISLVYKTAKMN